MTELRKPRIRMLSIATYLKNATVLVNIRFEIYQINAQNIVNSYRFLFLIRRDLFFFSFFWFAQTHGNDIE